MTVQIKGIEKFSVIDYPGRTCCIVFLADCNFRCPYCHNPDLIERPGKMPDVPEEDVLELLRSRRKWLDGVCITGGEPTLHRDLPEFIRKVQKEGFLVKLDTNGTNPGMVEALIREGLLDYVAMDIKAPPERYSEVVRADVDMDKVRKTVKLIMKSGVDYEFRTTVVPRLHSKEDIKKICEWLKGARRFFIQGFMPGNTLDKGFSNESAFPDKELEGFAEVAREYFKEVGVRT